MQQIEALSQSGRDWIAALLHRAHEFVTQLAGVSGEDELASLEALDAAWSAWLSAGETDVQRINDVLNAVGVAFGQWQLNAGTLRWVIAMDEHGTDLAVHGLPGAVDILVFPTSFVAKRYERRETEFLQRSYAEICEQIRAIQHTAETALEHKPWWKRLLNR